MSSEVQGRQSDSGKHGSRFGVPRALLRMAGVAAVAAALAAFASGGVSAQTWNVRTQAPAQCGEAAVAPNGKQWPAEPGMAIDAGATYRATLQTNCGTVQLDLEAAAAPRTVNSFAFLSAEQYFDHTKCHRLTTAGIYVLQCGDPQGNGMGGPGYRFPDENLAGATYPAGTVAMANAGPNTNGSQFFLVYQDSQLPPNYTPFGRVTAGMDVLASVAAAGTQGGADGAPANDVVLESVTTTRD
ncbi:peptidylprolyl isomerase [Nocardia brasiliensis]